MEFKMLPPRLLKKRSVMWSWNIFILVNWAGVFIWAWSTGIRVAETKVLVDRAGLVLIWTHRNFYKGNNGRVRSRLTGPAQSTGLIWTGSKAELERERSKYFINFVEKPQCCSHLQLWWNYVVGMLTNWAIWIDRVIARIDLSQKFHRFSQHLKNNSKEFLFVRWHPLAVRFAAPMVGCLEIKYCKDNWTILEVNHQLQAVRIG